MTIHHFQEPQYENYRQELIVFLRKGRWIRRHIKMPLMRNLLKSRIGMIRAWLEELDIETWVVGVSLIDSPGYDMMALTLTTQALSTEHWALPVWISPSHNTRHSAPALIRPRPQLKADFRAGTGGGHKNLSANKPQQQSNIEQWELKNEFFKLSC